MQQESTKRPQSPKDWMPNTAKIHVAMISQSSSKNCGSGGEFFFYVFTIYGHGSHLGHVT